MADTLTVYNISSGTMTLSNGDKIAPNEALTLDRKEIVIPRNPEQHFDTPNMYTDLYNFLRSNHARVVYNGVSLTYMQLATLDEIGADNTLFQPGSLLFTDMSRTGSYTEDGSYDRPYKSLTDATGNAASGDKILFMKGVYTEDVALPDSVSMSGIGPFSIINGTLSTTGIASVISDFQVLGITTISCPVLADRVFFGTTVKVMQNTLMAKVCNIASGSPALDIGAAVEAVHWMNGNIEGVQAISQVGGQLVIGFSFLQGNSGAPVVLSVGGLIYVSTTAVINLGPGIAMTLDNGAGMFQPNSLNTVFASSDVQCGAAFTMISGVYAPVVGGSNLIFQPAEQLSYTPTALGDWSGSAPTDLQNALDRIAAHVGPIP